MKEKAVWSPWYNALRKGDHYRAQLNGNKVKECLGEITTVSPTNGKFTHSPAQRHPECTICHPKLANSNDLEVIS